MAPPKVYDVVVVGGGAVGLAAAYEVAKAGKSVVVLEQNYFFNQAGSSGDMVRMFRTMYTELFMAKLAKESLDIWDELEQDAGASLRLMSGLLNFGDPKYGENSPEGTLTGPIENLEELDMPYKEYTAAEIEKRWPFKNLPEDWIGLYAPDNGVINVTLLLRTLFRLAKDYGADTHQFVEVKQLLPHEEGGKKMWKVDGVKKGTDKVTYIGEKIIITSGAYVNHVIKPSFDISFDLDIWEMTASYWTVNSGPGGTVFPSMWFQFCKDKPSRVPGAEARSQLFYGFPVVEWGPPNLARIAVDAATRRIKDPDERKTNEINADDIADVQEFVKDRIVGADSTVPAFSLSCLQTNVYDNMFVLDYIPEEYLNGGAANSVAVFTAGWAMKFVPLLGRALKEMVLDGHSDFKLDQFSMTRRDKKTGKHILNDVHLDETTAKISSFKMDEQASGSSTRCCVPPINY